jgi:hypothetical protein
MNDSPDKSKFLNLSRDVVIDYVLNYSIIKNFKLELQKSPNFELTNIIKHSHVLNLDISIDNIQQSVISNVLDLLQDRSIDYDHFLRYSIVLALNLMDDLNKAYELDRVCAFICTSVIVSLLYIDNNDLDKTIKRFALSIRVLLIYLLINNFYCIKEEYNSVLKSPFKRFSPFHSTIKTLEKKMSSCISDLLNIYIHRFILEKRITGELPPFEGIRIIKEAVNYEN